MASTLEIIASQQVGGTSSLSMYLCQDPERDSWARSTDKQRVSDLPLTVDQVALFDRAEAAVERIPRNQPSHKFEEAALAALTAAGIVVAA